jgi:integrase
VYAATVVTFTRLVKAPRSCVLSAGAFPSCVGMATCGRINLYRSIAASIVQSGLSVSDLLSLTYGDIKEEFEKGTTPICLSLTRKKTGVSFITFLGSWFVKLLKDYLAHEKLDNETPIYNVSSRAVHAYFHKTAEKFAGHIKGRNPYSPHSLRAAFRTFLSDHKVDPLYIEYWRGHALPGTTGRLHKQKR